MSRMKPLIAVATSTAIITSILTAPTASASAASITGIGTVDIVGRDIDPVTHDAAWTAFAQLPGSESEPVAQGSILTFTLPAQCVDKPRVENAVEPDMDVVMEKYRTIGNAVPELTREQGVKLLDYIKAHPESTIVLANDFYGEALRERLHEAVYKHGLDKNFTLWQSQERESIVNLPSSATPQGDLYGTVVGGITFSDDEDNPQTTMFYRTVPNDRLPELNYAMETDQGYVYGNTFEGRSQVNKRLRIVADPTIYVSTVKGNAKGALRPDDPSWEQDESTLLPSGATSTVFGTIGGQQTLFDTTITNMGDIVGSNLTSTSRAFTALTNDGSNVNLYEPKPLELKNDELETPTPTEFTKVTDDNGKDWWTTTMAVTNTARFTFDVKAHVDVDCLKDKGLLTPGTPFYLPGQTFLSDIIQQEYGNEEGKYNVVKLNDPETRWGYGVTTPDNPANGGKVVDGSGNGGPYRSTIPEKGPAPIHASHDSVALTRGVLVADRSGSYDQREGIYGNASCMVSRNRTYADELTTGVTTLSDSQPQDYDEPFPKAARKNGITARNFMNVGMYSENIEITGDVKNEPFVVEDMCDQAAARLIVPETPPVTTTVTTTPPTTTVTTTPPVVTTEVTTPVTETITSTPALSSGSSGGSSGGIFALLGTLTALAAIIGAFAHLMPVPVVVTHEPTPEPEPTSGKTIRKGNLICPADREVKGLCKPM